MTAVTTGLAEQPIGVRERLISATEVCLARNGIRRTTVVQVVAALVRTDEQFWADAESRVSAATGIAAQVG